MKPFDLEAAKRGDAIVRNDGVRLSFVAHVPGATIDQRLICMLEGGYIRTYTEDGRMFECSAPVLFMGPKKCSRTVFVNFYLSSDRHRRCQVICGSPHGSREEADAATSDWDPPRLGEAKEITLEWEE